VADKMSLPYRVAEAVSRDSKTPEGGQLTDLPGGAQLVAEAFESDVGVENSPLRGEGDSWVFYEVLEVTPERDRTLDEVRSEATSAWAAAETRNRIAARADALFERLKSGEPLATLAAEIRKPVQKIASMKRGEPPPELGTNAAAQAFAGPKGHVANAEGEGASRILLQVDDVVVPAFLAASADAASIKEQLAPAFLNDVIASYNQQVLQSRETRVNNAAFQQLTGRLQTQ
jgi:peptidyl-prolyl cis-trans isomerase D